MFGLTGQYPYTNKYVKGNSSLLQYDLVNEAEIYLRILMFSGFFVEYVEILKDNFFNLYTIAIELWQHANKLSPENSTILFRIGTTSITGGEHGSTSGLKGLYFNQALNNFKTALAITPTETKVLNNIGLTYIKFAQLSSDEGART